MFIRRSQSPVRNNSPAPRDGIARRLLLSTLALFCLTAVVAGERLFTRMISPANAAQQRLGDLNAEGLSQSALRQIQSLTEEKRSLTSEQRKMDSQLLFAVKKRRGEKAMEATPALEVGAQVDDKGETLVDITAEMILSTSPNRRFKTARRPV